MLLRKLNQQGPKHQARPQKRPKIPLTIGPPKLRSRTRRFRFAEIEKPWKTLLPHSKPLLLRPKH